MDADGARQQIVATPTPIKSKGTKLKHQVMGPLIFPTEAEQESWSVSPLGSKRNILAPNQIPGLQPAVDELLKICTLPRDDGPRTVILRGERCVQNCCFVC